MITELVRQFNQIFGDDGAKPRTFFAPGRVNLIGEHTDYNGGYVFPCGLDIGTYAVVRLRGDQKIRMMSHNFYNRGVIECDLNDVTYDDAHDWANYPKGVIKVFSDKGWPLESGFDVLYYGNLPHGTGLSSSASIELVTAVMLKELFNVETSMLDLVQLAQQAENDFVGVSCGIMDMFAIGMSKQDSAILLNCQTLEYQYSPLELEGTSLVITNSQKPRSLADSKYNERRRECERAFKDLQRELNIATLADLSPEHFETYQHLIKNDIDRKRAKHVVYENQRTISAVHHLQSGDIQAFGELMNASHVSLRDDYEVTGDELDTLAQAAWETAGVMGSRMTGAGFGGCTVSIVKDDALDSFKDYVGQQYKEQMGREAEFYVLNVGDGAREIV